MNERFETLYKLEKNLYKTDAPVIVSAGVLLKDTKTDSIIAQFKFQSVSKNTIIALKISIKAYDISNKEVQKIEEYQYLDLNINNGDYFGSDKAIIIPDKVTRLISIDKITVVFDNLTDCEILGDDLVALEKPKTLSKELQDFDLVKQYQIDCDTQGEFIPFEINNLWICTCGEINSSDICNKCKANKDRVLNSYNLSLLQEHLDLRKEQEKAEHEKQKQIAEQKRKEETERAKQKAESEAKQKAKLRKRNKIITIISSIVLTVVALILFTTLWLYPNAIKPYSDYCKAKELLASGQYSDAYTVFESLGDYIDSNSFANTALNNMKNDIYNEAVRLITEKNFKKAIEYFESIKDYKDSKVKIQEAYYNLGEYYLSESEYQNAIDAFRNADGYEDSKARINETYYNMGQYYLSNGEYQNALEAFNLSDNYNNGIETAYKWYEDKIDYNKKANQVIQGESNAVSNDFFALKSDGTVLAVGDNEHGECDVSNWENIVEISYDGYHIVGLRADGTVVATGENKHGECDVSSWKNVKRIFTGYNCTVGLCSNGTVVATGQNNRGQCNVSNWKNVIDIALTGCCTAGLCSDGKVYVAGYNDYLHKSDEYAMKWKDIQSICFTTNDDYLCGLQENGKIVNVAETLTRYGDKIFTTSSLSDVIEIFDGREDIIGLQEDGTVVISGKNGNGNEYYKNIQNRKDIIDIKTDYHHVVGLSSNGKVTVCGYSDYSDDDVYDWNDVVAIHPCGECLLALKKDGTVLVAGKNADKYDFSKWNNIMIPKE